jgi:hypothetical protein
MKVLKIFYEHLELGGRLLLDLFLPDNNFNAFEVGKFEGTSTFYLHNGDIITMEGKCVEADLFFQQYKVSYLKYEKWRKGNLIQSELQRISIRWYGVEEFKFILENIGFKNVSVSADFENGKKPTNGNQKFVYQATKK